MSSKYNDKLHKATVDWLQRMIDKDELDYMVLAESFMDIINVTRNYTPHLKEMQFMFSDGYTCFEAYCCFEDNGKTISSVKIYET